MLSNQLFFIIGYYYPVFFHAEQKKITVAESMHHAIYHEKLPFTHKRMHIKCLQIKSCRTSVSGGRLAFFRAFATEHSNFLHYNASMHNFIMTNRCNRIDISPLPYSLKSNAVFCLFYVLLFFLFFLWVFVFGMVFYGRLF